MSRCDSAIQEAEAIHEEEKEDLSRQHKEHIIAIDTENFTMNLPKVDEGKTRADLKNLMRGSV